MLILAHPQNLYVIGLLVHVHVPTVTVTCAFQVNDHLMQFQHDCACLHCVYTMHTYDIAVAIVYFYVSTWFWVLERSCQKK